MDTALLKRETGYEDSAACCDYIRWKRTLGKVEGYAPQLRPCAGKQECGEDLRGSVAHGYQVPDGLCIFYGELESSEG